MSLNIEVLPRIPAKVTGTDGITVAKSNGSMVIGFDYATSGFGAELAQSVSSANTSATGAATSETNAAASATSASSSAAAAQAAAGSLVIASQAEAQAGTVNNKGMSPLGTAQSIAARSAYHNIAEATAATVPADRDYIQTLGMDSSGIETTATWKQVASVPSHGAFIQDQAGTGRIFEIWIPYQPPNIMQFGGSVYAAADNTPALLKMLKYCQAKGLKWCQIPGTTLTFKTWPGELGQYGDICIEGAGRDKTTLRRAYNEATDLQGFFHYTQGRPKFSGMTLVPDSTTAGGCALAFSATSTTQPDVVSIEDVRITSGTPTGWKYGLSIDGSLKTTPAIGVRNTNIDYLEIFGCQVATARIVCAHLLTWHGGSSIADTGTGAASGGMIFLGTSAVPCDLVTLDMTTIAGDLTLGDYVTASKFGFGYVGGAINNTVNVTDVLTMGRVETGVQSNWVDSLHIDSKRNNGTDGTWTWRDLGNGERELFRSASLTATPTDFNFPVGFGSLGVAYYGFSDKPATVTAATGKVTASATSNITAMIGARGRV